MFRSRLWLWFVVLVVVSGSMSMWTASLNQSINLKSLSDNPKKRIPDNGKNLYQLKNGTLVNLPSTWECLKPRPFDLSTHFQENQILKSLPKPWIHIGMPKCGTTSLEHYWKCGLNMDEEHDDKVSHSTCKVTSKELREKAFNGTGMPERPRISCSSRRIRPCKLCGDCMREARSHNLPLLDSCGGYEAWAQMDTEETCSFPQLTDLDLIHKEAPNATFIFMFRDINKWKRSVARFKKGFMLKRFKRCQPKYWEGSFHLPEWFCSVVTHARNFVANHPSHAYLEVDLDDPNIADILKSAFGIEQSCWGTHNVNLKIAHKST